MLASSNKQIDGIKIDAYLTKDNKIALLNEEIMKKIGIAKEYIHNNSFDKIENLNIGTKVKQNKIISFDKLLQIYTNKYIIINLKENHNNDRNSMLVKNILNCTKSNSNIKYFFTSNSLNILNLILEENVDVKVGKFVNNSNDTNYSFDFYTVDVNNINLIPHKKNYIVVVSDIDSKEKYNFITRYNNKFKDLFFIFNDYNFTINNASK